MPNKQVTFYPTYGYQYQKGKDWIIPLRLWVRDPSDVIRRLAAKGARKRIRKKAGLGRLTDVQKRLFMSRAEGFIADSESNQKVIGDSGEDDPEVFRAIQNRYGDQVQDIRIRDVINDREKNPSRLANMTILP